MPVTAPVFYGATPIETHAWLMPTLYWSATLTGFLERHLVGHGETEQEAIDDLQHKISDRTAQHSLRSPLGHDAVTA